MDENNIQKKPMNTYLGLSGGEEGKSNMLEFDLITSRQKGEETRFLSVAIQGINAETGEEQFAAVSIDEETFNLIKTYFTQLEWNS